MKATLAAASAACLLFAACESGDTARDASEQPTTITKAELIKQGDDICAASSERMAAAAEALGEAPMGKKFAEDTVIPELRREAADLRELEPEPGDKADYDAILNALDGVIEKAETDPTVLWVGVGDPFAEVNRRAVDFGFEICGAS